MSDEKLDRNWEWGAKGDCAIGGLNPLGMVAGREDGAEKASTALSINKIGTTDDDNRALSRIDRIRLDSWPASSSH